MSHPVRLLGFAQKRRPMLVERRDADFVPALLAELKSAAGRARIDSLQAAARDEAGILKLRQPVHRSFNLLLVEAVCDTPGRPRLDPAKIDSAGFVIRRRAPDGRGWQAWLSAPEETASAQAPRLRGWLDPAALPDGDWIARDPDPTRRPPRLSAGLAVIDRALARRLGGESLAEDALPLFPAPPEVCAAAGSTVLYGLVPVTSSDRSEGPAQAPDYLDDTAAPGLKSPREQLRDHLSGYLRANAAAAALPRPGQTVSLAWIAAIEAAQTRVAAGAGSAEDRNLVNFNLLLRQLQFEFDAFGSGAAAAALLAQLNTLALVLREDAIDREVLETVPAGEFLREAARAILECDDSSRTPMPLRWGPVDAGFEAAVLKAAGAALSARAAQVMPSEGRYEAPDALYALQAFVRVKRDDGCPPLTVWSEASEAFRIAPWYESGDAPPVKIALPEISRDFLGKLKPNVAFAVPESLMNMLSGNSAKDLADGKGGAGGPGIGIDWICSFSIPIITLCAFIVFNIFLQLFDIVFRWMMFIKICIPFPRRK